MERLSLEKFDSSQISKQEAYNTKGGLVRTGGGKGYSHVGGVGLASSFESDIVHDNGGVSWDQTDIDVYEQSSPAE